MELSFLPSEHIPETFTNVALQLSESGSERLASLVQCLSSTWINIIVRPVDCICVYQYHVGTKNGVEGWHQSLNHQARRALNLLFLRLIMDS
jgi:hypothetical protein